MLVGRKWQLESDEDDINYEAFGSTSWFEALWEAPAYSIECRYEKAEMIGPRNRRSAQSLQPSLVRASGQSNPLQYSKR
jgi:hypothetical protein